MEKKVNDLLQESLNILGEDSDIMIIAHKKGQCGAVIHGSIDNNAKAIFACIHQPNNKIGAALYRILKLNVMNLLSNPTPYGQDLVNSISQIADSMSEEVDKHNQSSLN